MVPLNMNKLDLRDYLYHGYGVRALSVRSFIKQRPVEAHREGSNRKEYFRRQAIKFMTVEMDEPFIWPEKPENFDAYVFLCGCFGPDADMESLF
jgi:large subunit ribosomal protein L23